MMDQQKREELGRQIVAARKARGWSQATLAEMAHLAENTISKMENGKTGKGEPLPGNLRTVLDLLNLEPFTDTARRERYSQDVEIVRDVIGLVLMDIPEFERPARVHDWIRCIYAAPLVSE